MSDDPNGPIEPAAGDAPVAGDPYAKAARDLFSRNVGPGDNDYGRQPQMSPVLGLPFDVTKELDALRKIKEAAKNVSDNYWLGTDKTKRNHYEDSRTLRRLLEEHP